MLVGRRSGRGLALAPAAPTRTAPCLLLRLRRLAAVRAIDDPAVLAQFGRRDVDASRLRGRGRLTTVAGRRRGSSDGLALAAAAAAGAAPGLPARLLFFWRLGRGLESLLRLLLDLSCRKLLVGLRLRRRLGSPSRRSRPRASWLLGLRFG